MGSCPSRRLPAALGAVLLAGAMLGGCSTSGRTVQDHPFVIAPDTARALGYRIDWQHPDVGRHLKHLSVQGDSVFILDGQNYLTRLARDDGERIWRFSVGGPHEEVLGVTSVVETGTIHVTTGGSMRVYDAATGAMVMRHDLEHIAGTAPIRVGGHLVYGSRSGRLVWIDLGFGFPWKMYQVAGSIRLEPVLVGDTLVATGEDGTVMAIDSRLVLRRWGARLLDEVVAAPTGDHRVVFVAGSDQFLRAFDLNSGLTLWKVLTESPLMEPPILIEDRVYQQIPTEGLACFEAIPVDSPGGLRRWTTEVPGTVLTRRGSRLLVWDADGGRLSEVESARGGAIASHDLAHLGRLMTSDTIDGDLYAADRTGHLIRLVPRN